VPGPHRLPARPRPHHPQQIVSPPQTQDIHRSRGGPLPHPAHAHPRGRSDSTDNRQSPAHQRGPYRGDRSRPRPRPHSFWGIPGRRPSDEVCREFILRRRFQAQRAELRVVDVLEKKGLGLNLTHEVRDGILHHSKGKADLSVDGNRPSTLEGQGGEDQRPNSLYQSRYRRCHRAGIICANNLPVEAVELLGTTRPRSE